MTCLVCAPGGADVDDDDNVAESRLEGDGDCGGVAGDAEGRAEETPHICMLIACTVQNYRGRGASASPSVTIASYLSPHVPDKNQINTGPGRYQRGVVLANKTLLLCISPTSYGALAGFFILISS